MKYFKYMLNGKFICFRSEDNPNTSFPLWPGNFDYDQMIAEVESGTSTIEEVTEE